MLENNNDSLENKKWTCPFNNAVNLIRDLILTT